MAQVRIQRLGGASLPHLCMQCGDTATLTVGKTFSQQSGSTQFWFGVLVAALLAKRMRLEIPLCDRHRHHFLWRACVVWGGLGVVAVFLVGTLLLTGVAARFLPIHPGVAFAPLLMSVVVWLIAVIVASSTGIQSSEVTDYRVTLTGVSEQFVQAYEAHTNPFADNVAGWAPDASQPSAPNTDANPFENLG